MQIKEIIHKNVLPNGTLTNKPGAIETKGKVILGSGEGCGLPNCHCSDGYFISIIAPLKDGEVRGMKVQFDDEKEYKEFMETHELFLN